MCIFKILKFYNYFNFRINLLRNNFFKSFLNKTFFLSDFFLLNELIWQEGLLIDFLQKKITDNWIHKFLIYSANLFNERLVFDRIIRFYLDLILWPLHKFFIFEFNNVGGTLFINIFIFFFTFFMFSFFYFFLLMI